MRVLVVGFGSIGRRHLANLRSLEPNADITALRHRNVDVDVPSGADRVVHTLVGALEATPDVAFVCGPSAMHAEVGIALAAAGVHVFVEKPLALNSHDAWRLVHACAAAGRLLTVGYNLRFCTSLRAMHAAVAQGSIGRVMSARAEVGQYLPDWRPESDYRTTNSARADLGGGIVFELSHEIDYVRWLLGEVHAVDAVVGRTSDLDIDAADTADILLSCAGGRTANIHMNMTQRDATRRCQVVGTEGTLAWDGIALETRVYAPATGWSIVAGADSHDRNAMYLAQTAHVLDCVRGTSTPLVDGAAGARVVEVAQAALLAAREGRRIAV